MTVWWADPNAKAPLDNNAPVLIPGGRAVAIRALQDRIAGFVPEWRDLSEEDAGVALVRLFGLQLEPILARANRLPEKALVEVLRAAGLAPAPARSAKTIIAFTPEANNDRSVSVAPGTRLTSARSDGAQGNVTWETDDSLVMPNAVLTEMHRFDGEVASTVVSGEGFLPFGETPTLEAALYLGFSVTGDPGRAMTMAVVTQPNDQPKPVAFGGTTQATPGTVTTRWEALTATGMQPIDVSSDTSAGLTRSGIVSFTLPRDWIADRPSILGDGEQLHWLRLRLIAGRPVDVDPVAQLIPHAIGATAQETFRDSFPLPEINGEQVTIRLQQTPVLTGSIILEIDEGISSAGLFDLPEQADDSDSSFRLWSEVTSLAGQRPDARVFTLDAQSGVITFGDNIEGMQPPPGIRNIAVRSYAKTLGAAGNVGRDEVTRLPNAIAGVASATNVTLGAGGADAETTADTIRRGPAMIKARGRAVSSGDTALLSRFTPGADILRAYVLSGVDSSLGGAARPGTLSVFVLPRRHPSEAPDLPPAINSDTLTAVAQHLAQDIGTLGSRVVAAAPLFQHIRVEAQILVTPGRDAAAVESAVRSALDTYLNPEKTDWQLGTTLRHADMVEVVLSASDDITAVPFLTIAVDGLGLEACADAALSQYGLPWPARHRLAVEQVEAST